MTAFCEPRWVGKYVGAPYADEGFDRAGFHCWGLVWRVLTDEAGVEVSKYDALSDRDIVAAARAFRRDKHLPPWTEAMPPLRCFDVVTLLSIPPAGKPVERHVGVMVTSRLLLHAEHGTGVVKTRITHPLVRGRIVEIARHRDLAPRRYGEAA